MMTKVNVAQVSANTQGNVVSTATGVQVEKTSEEVTDLRLVYDQTGGVLRLSVPGVGTVTAEGFMTQSGIGVGTQGRAGEQGREGIDGLVGEHGKEGDVGCPGPRGERGPRGYRGLMGPTGVTGPTGDTGPTGAAGEDGRLLVFVSDEDPGPVGASAIWLRPIADE